jgi:hypothetical protein
MDDTPSMWEDPAEHESQPQPQDMRKWEASQKLTALLARRKLCLPTKDLTKQIAQRQALEATFQRWCASGPGPYTADDLKPHKRLPILDLHETPLFQPRTHQRDVETGRMEATCESLAETLRAVQYEPEESKRDLDPVMVVKLEGQWWIIDGHQRVEVYQRQLQAQLKHAVDGTRRRRGFIKETIPVLIWQKNIEEARLFSVQENLVTKTPLTYDQKEQMAWERMWRLPKLNNRELAREHKLCPSAIDRMGRKLRKVQQANPSVDWKHAMWSAVLKQYKGLTDSKDPAVKHAEHVAAVGRLLAPVKPALKKYPDVVAEAVIEIGVAQGQTLKASLEKVLYGLLLVWLTPTYANSAFISNSMGLR